MLTGRRVADPLDWLDLPGGYRLAVVDGGAGLAATPMVHRDGWRRALPGDGAAEALLEMLAAQRGSNIFGRFAVRSWTSRPARTERAIGVDQTNESVIVGDTAVVKWATHLQEGPHPAPRRITVLREARFTGMPAPWGMVTWQPARGDETVVAYVDEYLPGAVDGWTWAVEAMTAAALDHDPEAIIPTAQALGTLIAELHAALSATVSTAATADADRWHRTALDTLDTACATGDSACGAVLRARRTEVASEFGVLGTLAGATVLDGHGDLHVGQVLRSGDRFTVTDFDGNPVLTAAERVKPIPAVVDVAGMAQSLSHVAIVARRYTDLDPAVLHAVEGTARRTFLDTYATRLRGLGHIALFDPRPLRALRLVQVMREMIYAAEHLPRWMYVPDAALPALLDEERTP